MKAREYKTQENQVQPLSRKLRPKRPASIAPFQFINKRPEAEAQRKIQQMANSSHIVENNIHFQVVARNSALDRKEAQWQAVIGNNLLRRRFPAQRRGKNLLAPLPTNMQVRETIQMVNFDSEWDVGSRQYSKAKREAIKKDLIGQYELLNEKLAGIVASLKRIVLPQNSELGRQLSALEGAANPYIKWQQRGLFMESVEVSIRKAEQLAPQIAKCISGIPLHDILRMQGTEEEIRRSDRVTAKNASAAGWVALNAKNREQVPGLYGGTTDISSLLALRNSSNPYKNKPYHNSQKFFSSGSYQEVLDTGGAIGGWRVILDNHNPNVFWCGYHITHGGTTIYYWDGARWWHWLNQAGAPYPQEDQEPVPAVAEKDRDWLRDNRTGLQTTLDQASNPGREEQKRQKAEQARLDVKTMAQKARDMQKAADGAMVAAASPSTLPEQVMPANGTGVLTAEDSHAPPAAGNWFSFLGHWLSSLWLGGKQTE